MDAKPLGADTMSRSVDIDGVGDLILALGSPLFGSQYFDLFKDILSFDQCTVFAFRGSAPPNALVLEGKSAEMRGIAHALGSEYVAGGFEEDPNVRRRHAPLECPAVYCMRAEELQNRRYRLRFYDEPHLRHELVVLGQTADTLYYASFYRTDPCAAFQQAELQAMHGVARFAVKALHRHLELVGESPQRVGAISGGGSAGSTQHRQKTLAHLRAVLLAEPYMLSPREAEVCAGIILGYTTLGISLNFGISINTVATHRKRAYRKLGICSQNELFSRYFQVVNQQQCRELPLIA